MHIETLGKQIHLFHQIVPNFVSSAPLKLNGEGTYALSAVKEIKVTDDFLSLDMATRKCQEKESFEDCITMQYLRRVEQECNCIPYRLKNFTMKNQVAWKLYQGKIKNFS